jgi:hypothetical protein
VTLDVSGTSHGGGKFVIGEIGASLMKFSYQILNNKSFLLASLSCDRVREEEEKECS